MQSILQAYCWFCYQDASRKNTIRLATRIIKKITDLATVLTRREVNRFLPDTTTGLPVIVKDVKGQLISSQCDDHGWRWQLGRACFPL